MTILSILLSTLSLFGATEPSHGHPNLGDDSTPSIISVGDKVVKGSALRVFDNAWSRSHLTDGPPIRETTRFAKVNGKKCYIRDQYFPMQSGIEMHTELVLDRKTLATISLQKEILGLPEGAGLGARPVFARWEFKGSKYTCATRIKGELTTTEGSLEAPMFNGGGLGLMIAALPLKLDYEAKLPVAMALGMTAELTLYQVHIRVIGTEPYPREKGKDLTAFVVAVDWIDPTTGAISSMGGIDRPGGAYFVLPKPPKGYPHVLTYVNDGGSIDLELE